MQIPGLHLRAYDSVGLEPMQWGFIFETLEVILMCGHIWESVLWETNPRAGAGSGGLDSLTISVANHLCACGEMALSLWARAHQ